MQHAADVACTVVLPFQDDEEILGPRIRQLANHLRGLRLKFEILAIDEGSGDNSHFVLSLAHREIPELALVGGASRGRGFARGAELARGRILLLCDPRSEVPAASISLALPRLEAGTDAVIFPGRLVIARRARTWTIVSKLRGRMPELTSRFERRAQRAGLNVDAPQRGGELGHEERHQLQRLASRGPRAVFAMIAGAFSR